ncbi:hypothetical protein VAR608DRAFT_3048 [Variovorax sp. HW608]|nr:hypothetical protein VAR608DRAFT_3048 [Variovorax sp. HW608]
MYCHSLKMAKAGRKYDIPCEDSPMGFVAIWPYELNLEDSVFQDLLVGLRAWATLSGIKYKLYTSKDDCETNENGL